MLSTLKRTESARSSRGLGFLGVDIGRSAVKFAQIQRKRYGWVLRFGRVIQVPAGHDPWDAVVDAVKNTLDWRSVWFGQPVALVSSIDSELRNIELASSANESVQSKVAGMVGTASESKLFACWRSRCVPSPQPTEPYHLLAMDRSRASSLVSKLLKYGAECEALDTQPSCLARLSLLTEPCFIETQGVVDWSYDAPLFTVARNGRPYYTRHLRNCGFRQTLEALGHDLGLMESEAVMLLRKVSSQSGLLRDATSVAEVVRRSVAGPIGRFIDELNRSLSFLATEPKIMMPKRLILVGCGAGLPKIDEEITAQTGIPSIRWTPHNVEPSELSAESLPCHLLAGAASVSAIPLLS
jgi:Tfp pilus assembly PilM family ATPase